MRIEQSEVVMNATHSYSSETELTDVNDFESGFRTMLVHVAQASEQSEDNEKDLNTRLVLMIDALIAQMIEVISGTRNVQDTGMRDLLQGERSHSPDPHQGNSRKEIKMQWRSEQTESVREREDTCFSAVGKIRTSDGRLMDFNLELDMCRNYSATRKIITTGTVTLRDPLIVNFEGQAAELSGKRFAFDLDADGNAELIPELGNSSGFLAIDSNGDGRVTNGKELFGTFSGNGFADLAAYDEDGNHWIDEADPVFDSLRIWRNDSSEPARLASLQEEGIGALYLGSAGTPFELTDEEGRMLAQIRASGCYLRENGDVGSLQHVDLTI